MKGLNQRISGQEHKQRNEARKASKNSENGSQAGSQQLGACLLIIDGMKALEDHHLVGLDELWRVLLLKLDMDSNQ